VPIYRGDVIVRVLAMFEAGELIPMCAWCRRLRLDEWVFQGGTLQVLNVTNQVSHSICPTAC
jgi:hypothetical protein